MSKAIEELEAERAKRKDAIAKARREQYEKDLPRVNELELELGDDRVMVLKTPSFVAGLPTVVVVKTPASSAMKRYRDMVRRAKGDGSAIGKAADMLADTCVAFPDEETYKKMQEAWPSIHDNVAVEAVALGEAEGKA